MNPQFKEMQKRMNHIGNLNNYLEDLLAKIPGNLLSGQQQEKLMDVLLDDRTEGAISLALLVPIITTKQSK